MGLGKSTQFQLEAFFGFSWEKNTQFQLEPFFWLSMGLGKNTKFLLEAFFERHELNTVDGFGIKNT